MSEFRRVTFHVPGQPVAKGRPRSFVRGGKIGHHTPEKTIRYESTVALAAQQAMAGAEMIEGPVQLSIIASFLIPQSWSERKKTQAANGDVMPCGRPDLDNVAKAISDACNGIVWRDDSQVVTLIVRKRYGIEPGASVVVESWR